MNTVLIATRGEIAVRIINTCKSMGLRTVAAYSYLDRDSLHVHLADESICIGESRPAESYENIDRIVSAALVKKADLIHPGYGFLSENSEFAKKCKEHGLIFIGPSAELLELTENKTTVKNIAKSLNIPTLPDYKISTLKNGLEPFNYDIKYPVLLKDSFGAGGRGIHHINTKDDLISTLSNLRAAKNEINDSDFYIEEKIIDAKHIEVQIICDKYGNVVTLSDRDCSTQKNYKKVIEEAPSPRISATIRNKLYEASKLIVSKIKYDSVATFEFLVKDSTFFFLEINPRIQVEHTVTESITGLDLIKLQILSSLGERITLKNDQTIVSGVSIECRINLDIDRILKENSSFLIEELNLPSGNGVRVDHYLYQGYQVNTMYDNLLAKLIVHADTRGEAIKKMLHCLSQLVIGGLPTNIDYLLKVLTDDSFIDASHTVDSFKEGNQ